MTPIAGELAGAPEASGAPAPSRTSPAQRTTTTGRMAHAVVVHGPTILHVLSLVGAFVILLVIDRRMWFRVDDFDFLAKRGLHGALLSIWVPHGVHWSTIPILIYRVLFSLFGLRTARPYLLVVFLAHLALAHMLWRAMRAMGTAPIIATALAAIFALLGAGAPDILWAFQIGYVGSLLLGWGFVLLVNHDDGLSWRDAAAAVVGVAALMTSGVAVSMVVVGGLVALARRGWRAAALAVAPPAVTYVVWFVLVGHVGYQTTRSFRSTLLHVPGFVFNGLAAATSDATGTRFVGPVLLVALLLWALRRSSLARTPAAPALIGLAGTVVFLVITAFGRDSAADLGSRNARYGYVVIALLLPAAGLALSVLVARRRGRPLAVLAVVGLLVLMALSNWGELLTTRNRFTTQSLATEAQIVAAARIATTERVVPGSEPAANLDAPDLRLSVLTVFAHDGELPTGVHPGPSAVVGAATEIQLGVTGSALFLPGGLTILAPSGGYRVSGSAGGCESATSLTARADLRLRVGAPTALAYAGLPGGYLLASLTLGGLQGSSRRFNSGRAYAWLDIAAAPSLVNLHASAGVTFSTCAAGAVDQHLVT